MHVILVMIGCLASSVHAWRVFFTQESLLNISVGGKVLSVAETDTSETEYGGLETLGAVVAKNLLPTQTIATLLLALNGIGVRSTSLSRTDRHSSVHASTPDESKSYRQRLKETEPKGELFAEVKAIVFAKSREKIVGKWAEEDSRRRDNGIAWPLHDKLGAKPQFVKSASSRETCPKPKYPEIAFVGRSNAGKSSLLNALTGSQVARVENKPGITQVLNFFNVNRKGDIFTLVDLPGYGFAFASEEKIEKWRQFSDKYLSERETLKMVLIVCDVKTGLKDTDLDMIAFLEKRKIKYTVVFTKVDTAIKNYKHTSRVIQLSLDGIPSTRHFVKPPSIVSSTTGAGIGRLQRRILEVAVGVDPLAEEKGPWRYQPWMAKRSDGSRVQENRGGRQEMMDIAKALGGEKDRKKKATVKKQVPSDPLLKWQYEQRDRKALRRGS